VEVLQPCFDGPPGTHGSGFRILALAVIGLAACISGAKLLRWEPGPRTLSARWWVAAALTSWIAVGSFAWTSGRLQPVSAESAAWAGITEAQISQIVFDGLPPDGGIVAAMAPATLESATSTEFARRLSAWAPANLDDSGQSIRNLVSVAAVADLCTDPRESEIGRLVYRRITGRFDPLVARRALAWIILSPEDGQALTKAPELGLFRHPPERLVRQRSVIYAEKYLGRLLGRIPD
jgi:hypothetical protein